jgi:hypothetical protein
MSTHLTPYKKTEEVKAGLKLRGKKIYSLKPIVKGPQI